MGAFYCQLCGCYSSLPCKAHFGISLSGLAAVNINEPSPGDLERVSEAYRGCRAEITDLIRLSDKQSAQYNALRSAHEDLKADNAALRKVLDVCCFVLREISMQRMSEQPEVATYEAANARVLLELIEQTLSKGKTE